MLLLAYVVAALGVVAEGAQVLSACSGTCVGKALVATECPSTDSDCFCAHPIFLDTFNACIGECGPQETEGLLAVQNFCQTVGTTKKDLKRDFGPSGRRKTKKGRWPWNPDRNRQHRPNQHQPDAPHHWQQAPPQKQPPPPAMEQHHDGMPSMMTQTVLPYPTQTVLPYPTQTVLPYPTQTVLPYPTQTVLPYPTQTVLPYPTQTVLPGYSHTMW